METVLNEGGPFHVRGELAGYLERLRETDRGHWIEELKRQHPDEIDSPFASAF